MKNNNTTLTEKIELMLDVLLLPVVVLFIVLLSGCRIDKEEKEDAFKPGRVNTSVCCYCDRPAHDAMLDNGNIQNYHISVTRKNRKFKDEYIVCSDCWDKYGALDDIQSTDGYIGCTFWQQAD